MKPHNREDYEDRSIEYRNWLRTVIIGGVALDADMIHWRKVGDEYVPFAYTELTRTDSEDVPSTAYLIAILARYKSDLQGYITEKTAEMLHCPAYIVLFPKSVSWIYVYSFNRKEWKLFTPKEWEAYLNKLSNT